MKKIILSALFMGTAAVASAQKSEVAEAKKIWDVYDITLNGPEVKGDKPAQKPGGNEGAKKDEGIDKNILGGSGDGKRAKTKTQAVSTTRLPSDTPKPPSTYVDKQLKMLNSGLTHTNAAIVHDKTKDTSLPWVYRALFASQIALVDTLDVPNSLKHQEIAEESIEKAKTLKPEKAELEQLDIASQVVTSAIRRRGVVAYNNQDYKTAYDQFLLVTKREPNDTSMYANVGYMAREMKNYPDAIANYKKAIAMNSPESNTYYKEILKMTLVDLKDTTAGISLLQEAAAKYPNELDYLTLETDIYIKRGETAKAEAMLDKLIAKDPKNPLFLRVKADTYFNQAYDLQTNIRKLEDAKKYKEADVEIKKKTELLKKALPIYLKIEEITPKDAELVKMIKQIYFVLGDEAKSTEYAKKQAALN